MLPYCANPSHCLHSSSATSCAKLSTLSSLVQTNAPGVECIDQCTWNVWKASYFYCRNGRERSKWCQWSVHKGALWRPHGSYIASQQQLLEALRGWAQKSNWEECLRYPKGFQGARYKMRIMPDDVILITSKPPPKRISGQTSHTPPVWQLHPLTAVHPIQLHAHHTLAKSFITFIHCWSYSSSPCLLSIPLLTVSHSSPTPHYSLIILFSLPLPLCLSAFHTGVQASVALDLWMGLFDSLCAQINYHKGARGDQCHVTYLSLFPLTRTTSGRA